jgi:hypothetical protein
MHYSFHTGKVQVPMGCQTNTPNRTFDRLTYSDNKKNSNCSNIVMARRPVSPGTVIVDESQTPDLPHRSHLETRKADQMENKNETHE